MATRIAIIGCGAVAHAHLPVIAASKDAEVTLLVDKNGERAKELAAANDIANWSEDLKDVASKADAAIIALPHHLHAPISTELLEQGVHVLVEKPMAMSTAECDAMIAAADKSGAVLSVALISRLLGVSDYVKAMIDGGMLGTLQSFEINEGMVYDWPVASDFMFKREAGGGVLSDLGAHVLDVVVHWFGDFAEVDYRDDSMGGAEADCELALTMKSGVRGSVCLSRSRDLGNTWLIEGELGTLEVQRSFGASYRWRMKGTEIEVSGTIQQDGKDEDPLNCFHLHLADFLDSIEKKRTPRMSGAEGRRAVELIERCHATRKPLERNWESWRSAQPAG